MGLCQYKWSRHYSGKQGKGYVKFLKKASCQFQNCWRGHLANIHKRNYEGKPLQYASGPAQDAPAFMCLPRGCQGDTSASSGKQHKLVTSRGSKKMNGGSELGGHIAGSSKFFFINVLVSMGS